MLRVLLSRYTADGTRFLILKPECFPISMLLCNNFALILNEILNTTETEITENKIKHNS